MRLFRFFHRLVLASLLLVSVFFVVSTIILLLSAPQESVSQLHSLIQTTKPATPTLPLDLVSSHDTLTLVHGEIQYATPSASLLSLVNANSRWFAPLSRPKPHFVWNEAEVKHFLQAVAVLENKPASPAAVILKPGKKTTFEVFPGKQGLEVDTAANYSLILHTASATASLNLITHPTGQVLTSTEVATLSAKVKKLITTPLTFTAADKTITLTTADAVGLLTPDGIAPDRAREVVANWAKNFDSPAVEPELKLDGTKVISFIPPQNGQALEQTKAMTTLTNSVQAVLDGSALPDNNLATIPSSPKTPLSATNTLGINELIGHGDSEFHHSIPGRVHNVGLTTQRINAHIVMPGESFSFAQTLGEVSARTGFQPAYVIMQGQTVLGDGGGVCQVSSTMFRTILNAGLPILERKGHSYRVGYYEQNSKPGFDATVYSPHPDLVFKNDTTHAILIYAQADLKNLSMYIDFYGTKDGRLAEIKDYSQWDASPAPATVYQDDPTLPVGTLKQIDFAAGGLKTKFTYHVTYTDGTIKDTTYATTYIPWRAVYLRGTKQ